MPSLFSRFKHGKSRSSSSTESSPTSPTQARLNPSRDDVAVIDQASPRPVGDSRLTPAGPRPNNHVAVPPQAEPISDSTGHPPAFADETERPELPTTSSNVNNTVPTSSTSKELPTLPEIGNVGSFESPFSLPPGAAPASTTPPPMPHVMSVDRSGIKDSERERPKPIVSDSKAIAEEEEGGVGGRFPHVQEVPARAAPVIDEERGAPQPGNGEQSRADRRLEYQPEIGNSSTSAANRSEQSGSQSKGPRESLKSSWGPDVNGEEHIERHLAELALRDQDTAREQYGAWSTAGLEASRAEMSGSIAKAARARTAGQSGLSDVGTRAFRDGGLGEFLGKADTLDAHTQWMEPVIQENIIRKEHTEFMTIIDRDIEKHHVYPKIQPIYDPKPTVLETRHRIFSSADGQWHEVVGDAAAIAILGEDAFHNGKNEKRQVRNLDFGRRGKQDGEGVDDGIGAGTGRVREREGVLGGQMGQWREVGRSTAGQDMAKETGARDERGVWRESRVGRAL